jgi:hypothetical protein
VAEKQNGLAGPPGAGAEASLKNIARIAAAMEADARAERSGEFGGEVDAKVQSGLVVAGGLKFDKSPEQGQEVFPAAFRSLENFYRLVTYCFFGHYRMHYSILRLGAGLCAFGTKLWQICHIETSFSASSLCLRAIVQHEDSAFERIIAF